MKEVIKIQLRDIWPETSSKEPKNNSPVLDYCRKLIADGRPYGTRLEVYRGDVLALIVPKIGKGTKWAILENEKYGPEFKKYIPFPSHLKRTAN